MRQLRLLAAVALIGGTAVGCAYETRVTDGPYTTQYVVAPPGYATEGYYSTGSTTAYVVGPTYSTQYVMAPAPVVYRSSTDWDGDGVPNWRDRRPNNPYRF